jgi:hypothetical protein
MASPYLQAAVVPAIEPRPPQVTLLGSSVKPDNTSDPASSAPDADQLAALPAELRAELSERKGEMWVRGLTYQPENHFAAWPRDRCDFTTVDYAELPAPSGLALERINGGTVSAATHEYQVTAIDANGHTTPCTLVSITLGSIGSVVLTWQPVADGVQYGVYGRTGGSIGLLAIVGPFDNDETPTYTDTGAASPGAVPPVTNTTGGPGTYTNLPIITYVPFVIDVVDTCSSFGFEEHDFKGRVARLCDNATPQALERELWGGYLAQAKSYPNNYLTNDSDPVFQDLTPGSGPPSVARGLQILQDALAQTGFGGQGMIHTQAQTAPNLLGARRVGKDLFDIFDNIIVPGVGYPGTIPGGGAPDAGTAYMYATDLVMTRIEDEVTVFPDTFSEALDRGQAGFPNTITFRGQRFGAAYWDGAAHFACSVTLAS